MKTILTPGPIGHSMNIDLEAVARRVRPPGTPVKMPFTAAPPVSPPTPPVEPPAHIPTLMIEPPPGSEWTQRAFPTAQPTPEPMGIETVPESEPEPQTVAEPPQDTLVSADTESLDRGDAVPPVAPPETPNLDPIPAPTTETPVDTIMPPTETTSTPDAGFSFRSVQGTKVPDLERLAQMLHQAMGAVSSVDRMAHDLKGRLYGAAGEFEEGPAVATSGPTIPRLLQIAERLRDQALRAHANLIDVNRIA